MMDKIDMEVMADSIRKISQNFGTKIDDEFMRRFVEINKKALEPFQNFYLVNKRKSESTFKFWKRMRKERSPFLYGIW